MPCKCWCNREYKTNAYTVSLTAGAHDVRLEYYDNIGKARVTLTIA